MGKASVCGLSRHQINFTVNVKLMWCERVKVTTVTKDRFIFFYPYRFLMYASFIIIIIGDGSSNSCSNANTDRSQQDRWATKCVSCHCRMIICSLHIEILKAICCNVGKSIRKLQFIYWTLILQIHPGLVKILTDIITLRRSFCTFCSPRYCPVSQKVHLKHFIDANGLTNKTSTIIKSHHQDFFWHYCQNNIQICWKPALHLLKNPSNNCFFPA